MQEGWEIGLQKQWRGDWGRMRDREEERGKRWEHNGDETNKVVGERKEVK